MNITATTIKARGLVYSACRAVLGERAWNSLFALCPDEIASGSLSSALSAGAPGSIPKFLPDLARLEEVLRVVRNDKDRIPREVDRRHVNPTVRILELSWKNLTPLLDPAGDRSEDPIRTKESILCWYDPGSGRVVARPVTDEDLLVLKIVVEALSPEAVAAGSGIALGAVDAALVRASSSGLLLTPPSRIRRDPEFSPQSRPVPEEYLSSPSFTLQWHVTQACDLHCRHCYDRSSRSPMTFSQSIRVLDDLRRFCEDRNVTGTVSFTGGNPLLLPEFTAVYRAAAERGFNTAILGNPAPKPRIAELISIQKPSFYQVSLEGLREHDDAVRGPGHFDSVMAFLDVLRELGVPSRVMLTLTGENMDQVLPLTGILRGKADAFHFNRLSRVGEGANLDLPDVGKYPAFLRSYVDASHDNPVLGIKDNLINIIRRERGMEPFGGCTGCGCGAAFNFVALLPDGEVHACRKFPSLIGNILRQDLAVLYDSDRARRYRSGSQACRSCAIRPVCGGCAASSYSRGLNVFEDKDPFCFINNPPR